MKRVIRIRDRWGPQPWQSLPLAVQGQGLYWRNPYTEAPSSIQDTASLRFSFGGQQLLVLACSCNLVSQSAIHEDSSTAKLPLTASRW